MSSRMEQALLSWSEKQQGVTVCLIRETIPSRILDLNARLVNLTCMSLRQVQLLQEFTRDVIIPEASMCLSTFADLRLFLNTQSHSVQWRDERLALLVNFEAVLMKIIQNGAASFQRLAKIEQKSLEYPDAPSYFHAHELAVCEGDAGSVYHLRSIRDMYVRVHDVLNMVSAKFLQNM